MTHPNNPPSDLYCNFLYKGNIICLPDYNSANTQSPKTIIPGGGGINRNQKKQEK